MEKITHLISLSIGTVGADDHARTFQEMSELSANLAPSHPYVSLSSNLADDNDVPDEDIFYDEQTLFKVRDAVEKAITVHFGLGNPKVTTDVIIEMQNAGILFRERR